MDTDPSDSGTTPALAVVRAVNEAIRGRDYGRLRSLVHPDAVLYVDGVEPDPLVHGPDAFVEHLAALQRDTMYHQDAFLYGSLSATVVWTSTYVRLPIGRSGHAYERRWWLCAVRDGKLHRSASFSSESDARAAFAAGWPAS